MTNTRKITKRFASIILSVAMLLSMICVMGTVSIGTISADAASSRVSLYCATPYFSKYGFTSYEVFIQTKDNARNQKVFVHYNYMNGEPWKDSEAELYTTLSDGTKIWKTMFTSYSTAYCIKYVADGKTYWDNNNGRNYGSGTSIGANTPIVSQKLGYQYSEWTGFQINALLQNYAYHKNVFVRYTTDNWKTHRDQALYYSETNSYGQEIWTTYLSISNAQSHSEDFHYALCYQVNGRTYWANNFGENYGCFYYLFK